VSLREFNFQAHPLLIVMEIMKMMGHGSIAMTIRYAHLAPSQLRESVCAIDSNPQKTNIAREPTGAA
jgi:hypothetical protein